MEGDIDKSHIMMGVKRVYPVAFLSLEVAKKYEFESPRGELGQRKRVILNKGHTFKDSKKKEEERRGG